MSYIELIDKINELENEEFNIRFIDQVTRIIKRANDLYIMNINNVSVDHNDYYQIVIMIDDLLKRKVRELDGNLSNMNINSIVNGIEKNSLIIDDILKVEDYVFLKGTPIFSFSKRERLEPADDKLKDISTVDFLNFSKQKKNYLNIHLGRLIVKRIIAKLNEYLKEYFNLKDNVLIYTEHDVIYHSPMLNIYFNLDLNEICEKINNNEVFDIDIVITCNNEEFYLFNLNVNQNNLTMSEVDFDLWKLSEQNTNKKTK